MVRSLCAFAFLLLSAVAPGSEGVGDRKVVELVKRAGTNTRAVGQIVSRAEPAKLSRRQQGGVADKVNAHNVGHYWSPDDVRHPSWNPSPGHGGIIYPVPGGITYPGPGGIIGGGGGVSGGSSGSYSYSSVISVCYSLIVQIQSCQTAIISGGIDAQVAMQQVQQLAAQFQAFISQFLACSPCYANSGLNAFSGLFSKLFSALNALVTSCQQYYPAYWSSIFTNTFGGLNDSLASFLALCQSKGLAVNNFMPQSLSQFWGQVGLTSVSVVLRQYGYST